MCNWSVAIHFSWQTKTIQSVYLNIIVTRQTMITSRSSKKARNKIPVGQELVLYIYCYYTSEGTNAINFFINSLAMSHVNGST